MKSFLAILIAILLTMPIVEARRAKIYGSIQQTYIPPTCICGKESETVILSIPEGEPDCIPHVITTLSCGIYTYSLTVYMCNTYVGTILSYGDGDDDDIHCMFDYGINLGCANQTINGICRMKYDVVIQDMIDN